MIQALLLFFAGVAALFIGDRLNYYYQRYKSHYGSSRFPCGWKPPLWCVFEGHRFKRTEYGVSLIPGLLKTVLEVCERKNCGMGRMMTLQGPSFETPENVRKVLESAQAIESGQVLAFGRGHSPAGPSGPIPPAS